jgi:uncharacterized protein DUF6058
MSGVRPRTWPAGTVAGVVLTDADREYVRKNFVPLEDAVRRHGDGLEAVRELIEDGRLPRPSYVLDDGTELVPADYFQLADEAGGIDRLRGVFLHRYRAAAAAQAVPVDAAEDEWRAYLTGEYGVCLHHVGPETIVRKSALVHDLETRLADPRPNAGEWRAAVRTSVAELDALERPFAPHYDRLRFGGPSSRDRLITAVRERYPEIFAAGGEEAA